MTGTGTSTQTPAVTLHVWEVPTRRLPRALGRVAADRLVLRTVRGARFAKVLGTGDGATFRLRDATPHRWAVLVAWDDPAAAAHFDRTAVARGWDALSARSWSVTLRPLASRGRWSGREPFGRPLPDPAYDGPVAAVTRARLRLHRAASFWHAVPPVSADLGRAVGLRLAIGIGEAPVGLQGTFSIWDSPAALRSFAYERRAHREVVAATGPNRWYAEELFARFAVVGSTGALQGVGDATWKRP